MQKSAILLAMGVWLSRVACLPTVTISAGTLIGTTTTVPSASVSVNQFLGVPFAAIPTDTLRWAPPQAAPNFGTKNVNKWSASCMQQFMDTSSPPTKAQLKSLFNTGVPGDSEDCLYLNIYVPSGGATAKTVMFWIYGGALTYGTASSPYYDGSGIAANQDVIVVAANYRTNIFGFPHASELPQTSWNLGFLDQRLALQWVQNNIAAFGGDPTKVTIFGESSGATSVDRLVTTYPSNAPFRAAIMQSGTYSVTSGGVTGINLDSTYWNTLAYNLGCSSSAPNLKCMRSVSATTIQAAIEKNNSGNYPFYHFYPIPDGVTQLSNPEVQRLAGKIAKVPILEGTNAQEGRLFSLPWAYNGGFKAWLNWAKIPTADQTNFVNAYAIPGTFPDDDSAVAAAWTEGTYLCPARNVTLDSTAAGIPAWRYYFNASFPNYYTTSPFQNRGPFHTYEIPLVFGTYPSASATAQEVALSKYIQTAWATFAKNPTGGPDANWPKVSTASGGAYIGVLGNSGSTAGTGVTIQQSTPLDTRCSLWAGYYTAPAGGNLW